MFKGIDLFLNSFIEYLMVTSRSIGLTSDFDMQLPSLDFSCFNYYTIALCLFLLVVYIIDNDLFISAFNSHS